MFQQPLISSAVFLFSLSTFAQDPPTDQTVGDQIRILAENFGVKQVTLVGDRGMLKGPQIKMLPDQFQYITAITKPQILKMLNDGVIQ